MDLSTILREVATWPVDDRLRLIEGVWDGLETDGADSELSDELKAELDRRLAAADAAPDDVISWEEIEQYVRRPR